MNHEDIITESVQAGSNTGISEETVLQRREESVLPVYYYDTRISGNQFSWYQFYTKLVRCSCRRPHLNGHTHTNHNNFCELNSNVNEFIK